MCFLSHNEVQYISVIMSSDIHQTYMLSTEAQILIVSLYNSNRLPFLMRSLLYFSHFSARKLCCSLFLGQHDAGSVPPIDRHFFSPLLWFTTIINLHKDSFVDSSLLQ